MPLRRPLRHRRLAVVEPLRHPHRHQRMATSTRYSASKQAGLRQNGIGAAHSAWGTIVP